MTKNWFEDKLSINAGQKYCRMLIGGAFCNTFDLIKLPLAIKTFVLLYLFVKLTVKSQIKKLFKDLKICHYLFPNHTKVKGSCTSV